MPSHLLMLPTPYIKNLDPKVYEPAEDSFLLLDCLEHDLELLQNLKFPVVCEIGGGSGIVSAFLRMNVFPQGTFFATDVNPAACKAIKKAMEDVELDTASNSTSNTASNTASGTASNTHCSVADVFQMSLTSAVRLNTVDILVFNPPYVPAEDVPKVPEGAEDEQWLDLALLGGSDGMVVTWQVLDHLDQILSPNGSAYILFCARNNPDNVKAVMQQRGWAVKVVMTRKAGWEVLSVLEFHRCGG